MAFTSVQARSLNATSGKLVDLSTTLIKAALKDFEMFGFTPEDRREVDLTKFGLESSVESGVKIRLVIIKALSDNESLIVYEIEDGNAEEGTPHNVGCAHFYASDKFCQDLSVEAFVQAIIDNTTTTNADGDTVVAGRELYQIACRLDTMSYS